MKKVKVVVDRIEGRYAILIPVEREESIRIPKDWLPPQANANSVVEITLRRDRKTEKEIDEELATLRKQVEKIDSSS